MLSIRRLAAGALATGTIAALAHGAELVASKEPGWPQWRGPRRDGVSDEKGLLGTWPADGPKLLWKANGLGGGYCSPIISRGTIYITGDEDKDLSIFALDLQGRRKWKAQNGESWTKSWPGSRASCCYSDGLLYHMNAHGRLACLNPDDGSEVWSVSILETYASQNITWGISESPLVVDGKVFITPAGSKALMVALDAKTGKEIWRTPALDGEKPAYSSSIMVETGKGRQLITGGSAHAFGVNAATGRVLWSYRHEIDTQIMLTPSYYRGNVVVSLCVRDCARYYALALDKDENAVKKAWLHEMGNPYGSVVCADGNVVCSSSHKLKGWACIDAETGEIKAKLEGISHGSAIYADGRFCALCATGKMMLLEADDAGLRTVSEFDFVKGKKDVWAHPVICDGRLYLRYADTLYCYDVKE